MSIESFRNRAREKIEEALASQWKQFRNIHIEAVELQAGVQQKPTAEQIGMMTVTLTSRIWALEKAREILDETLKELVDYRPALQEGEDGDGNTEESGGGYG